MEFIDFEKGKQKEFMHLVKEKSKLPWLKLAKSVNKSRSTILAYLREDCKIPKEIFDKLNEKYEVKFKDTKIISLKNTRKKIKFPKLSNQLSEFLGALAGDGHLHKYPAELSITCHAELDKEYIYYLCDLSKKLFDQEPTIIFQANTMKLRIYSTELVKWLNEKYGFPIGRKKGSLIIPNQLKSKKSYLINFIKGVFDTDGTINRHHKRNGAIVEIISRDTQFLNQIDNVLKELQFKTSLSYKGVKIYNRIDIIRFFKLIKPNNMKHNVKYEIFKKRNFVPLNKEIFDALVV